MRISPAFAAVAFTSAHKVSAKTTGAYDVFVEEMEIFGSVEDAVFVPVMRMRPIGKSA